METCLMCQNLLLQVGGGCRMMSDGCRGKCPSSAVTLPSLPPSSSALSPPHSHCWGRGAFAVLLSRILRNEQPQWPRPSAVCRCTHAPGSAAPPATNQDGGGRGRPREESIDRSHREIINKQTRESSCIIAPETAESRLHSQIQGHSSSSSRRVLCNSTINRHFFAFVNC